MIADRENVAQALDFLGYQIDRHWRFKLREDERTASAVINKDGYIHDFGNGFHGDLGNVLSEFHGFSKREAFIKAKELLKLPISIDFSDFVRERKIPLKSGFMKEEYIGIFLEQSKERPKLFLKLLRGLFANAFCEEKMLEVAKRFDIGLSYGMVLKSGEKTPERLIMPIRNEEGQIITLWKYNPFLPSDYKVRYTWGRNRGAFNINALTNFDRNSKECLFVCEGEKDVLNAVANGIHAITPGGASCLFEEKYLPFFKGLRVVVLGDNDEAGRSFNEKIEAQIKSLVATVMKFNWTEYAKIRRQNFVPQKGFDLTDWLNKTKKSQ